MKLHTIKPDKGARQKRKRVARGSAAGGGTTAGRGTKGQQARAGSKRRFGFEGGQSPLIRRQPKLGGFRNPNREECEAINLDTIATLDAGSYDETNLRDARIVRTKKPVKILGRGEVSKKYNLTVHAVSKTAKEAIEKAGGSVTIIAK